MSATGGQSWSTAVGTYSPAGANQTIAIFWCTFNGTWSGNPSVTVGAGNTLGLSAIMYVFVPNNSSSLWGVNINPTNSTSNVMTTNQITGVTTTASNTVTMAFWSVGATNTWNTLTAGWSKPNAQYRNTTSGQSHTGAYKIMAAPGATGPPGGRAGCWPG